MAKDPLVSFQQTWSRRASTAQSRGYSPTAITPVYQMDLQRIQRGAQPYTEAEAGDAIAAAAGVQPIQYTGGSKPDWNPLKLIGRGLGDVGSTLKGLLRIPHAIGSDLSHIGQFPGAISKGAGEIAHGDFGHGLQDISHAPGLQSTLLLADLVPGLNEITAPITAGVLGAGVAGQALTPEGRKEISQHPGIALMNLLPTAGEAGLLGRVMKTADLTDAEAARTGLSAEELAQKQAIRVPGKIRVQLEKLPQVQQVERALMGKGWGKTIRQHLYGITADFRSQIHQNVNLLAEQNGFQEWASLPEAVQKRVTEWAGLERKTGQSIPVSVLPAEYQHLVPKIQQLIPAIAEQTDRMLSDRNIAAVRMPESMGGGVEHYKTGSRVDQAFKTREKRQAALVGLTDKARLATEKLRAAEEDLRATEVNGERPNIGKLVDDSSTALATMKGPDFSRMMTSAQRNDFVRRGATPPQGVVIVDARELAAAKAASARLLGADGPVQGAVRRLSAGQHSAAVSTLSGITATGLLDRIAKVDPQAATALKAQIEELAQKIDEHIGSNGLLQRNKTAREALDKARASAINADKRAKTASATASKAHEAFIKNLNADVSSRFMPMVANEYWKTMEGVARDLYSGDPARLDQAMAAIKAKDMDATFGDLAPKQLPGPFTAAQETLDPRAPRSKGPAPEPTTGPQTGDITATRRRARASAQEAKAAAENKIFPDAEKTLRDVASHWTQWRAAGFDPVFLHKMSESVKGKLPTINPGALMVPTIEKSRALDVSGGYLNLGFGFIRSEAEIIARQMGETIVNDHIIPHFTQDAQEAIDNLLARKQAAGQDVTRRQVENELMKGKVAFNSSPFGVRKIKGTTERIIDANIQNQIDRMGSSWGDLGPLKAVRNAQGMYVFAVTGLSPLHMAHVTFAAILVHAAVDPIETLQKIRQGARLMQGDTSVVPEGVPISFRKPLQFDPEYTQMLGAGHKTLARVGAESRLPAGVVSAADKALWLPRKMQELQVRYDTYVSQIARATEYIIQRKKGFDPEEALYETGRVFSLFRDMNNIERNILRVVSPFYGWTKFLVKFALQYPVDHPIRAGIVSNFVEMEQQDWGSGLPQDLSQMFFLGKPDALGKQTAFDIRQINPFRDVGRDFTWAGFAGALNPALDAVLQSMGVDTYTGSAELYPELHVDPNTGNLSAKGSNFFGNLINSALPQAKGIEGLLGWSDQMRTLKKTDPSAFSAAIFRSFHIPWAPRQLSIPQARAKMQLNQRRVAESAASRALETGDFSAVSQYNEVPYRGQLLTPQQLAALYQMARKAHPGENPKTALRNLKFPKAKV